MKGGSCIKNKSAQGLFKGFPKSSLKLQAMANIL